MEKAFVEYAYDVVSNSKEPLSLREIFDKALKLSGLSLDEDAKLTKMSKLYMSMSEDERFVLIDKKWDLSARHSFSQIHKNDVDLDDEEEEDMDEEEKEYLREEAGEEAEEEFEEESDDLDFDKKNPDEDEDDDLL